MKMRERPKREYLSSCLKDIKDGREERSGGERIVKLMKFFLIRMRSSSLGEGRLRRAFAGWLMIF